MFSPASVHNPKACRSTARGVRQTLYVALTLALALALCACSGGASGGGAESAPEGADYSMPDGPSLSAFDAGAATGQNGALIDTSHTADGYVSASCQSSSRLKFQVTLNGQDYNYDLPGDGTPIVCPINIGDGHYTFRVMQNTSGDRYVELCRTEADVTLQSEFAPFLTPNVFCNYDQTSACVAKAREVASGASNQAEVVKAVFDYVTQNVTYDYDKATRLSSATGYVPDPDQTLAQGKGICFDYASLGAAMLRSLGIPTKVMTGYISPDDLYHSWIMVYVDGTWKTAEVVVDRNTWSRVDLTFAAASKDDNSQAYVGDGKSYTDRYTY